MSAINDFTYIKAINLRFNSKSFLSGVYFGCLAIEKLSSQYKFFLHAKEEDYFQELKYPKRQYSYLMGRYCAKQALSIYTDDCLPTDIFIDKGVFDQPVVYCKNYSNLQVSISHTETMGAALAFPESYPMAIDIETIDSNQNDAIMTQLTSHERKALFTNEGDEIPLQLIWTIKEALSKVLKCGLTVPFEVLEVESISKHSSYYKSYFKNFPQYQALSFLFSNAACSIVYPKQTKLDMDVMSIQNRFQQILCERK